MDFNAIILAITLSDIMSIMENPAQFFMMSYLEVLGTAAYSIIAGGIALVIYGQTGQWQYITPWFWCVTAFSIGFMPVQAVILFGVLSFALTGGLFYNTFIRTTDSF